jgi:hypothetical protein
VVQNANFNLGLLYRALRSSFDDMGDVLMIGAADLICEFAYFDPMR